MRRCGDRLSISVREHPRPEHPWPEHPWPVHPWPVHPWLLEDLFKHMIYHMFQQLPGRPIDIEHASQYGLGL